jgi:diguanylate cyclase (GGDEF)-like protein
MGQGGSSKLGPFDPFGPPPDDDGVGESTQRIEVAKLTTLSMMQVAAPYDEPNTAETSVVPDGETARFATPHTIVEPVLTSADRATLTMLSGPAAGAIFPLGDEILLGRDASATVRVDDPAVSRKHARVRREVAETYVVEDLGSANGTFVGSRRVTMARLRNGDRLQIGPTVSFRFAIVDAREESLQRSLYEASTRDALTDALNRKSFFEQLDADLAQTRQNDLELSVLMLDLDHFKQINDRHGHVAGDRVLRSVAIRAAQMVRTDDLFGRYGGEEFIVLARGADAADAVALAERLRRAIESLPIDVIGDSLTVTVSIGVATLSECEPTATAAELVELADSRLYGAKLAGRNRVCSTG